MTKFKTLLSIVTQIVRLYLEPVRTGKYVKGLSVLKIFTPKQYY